MGITNNISAVVLALFTTCSGIFAATVTLAPTQDGTLYEDATGQTANGAGEALFAGRVNTTTAARIRRGLVRFDLSAIPGGSTITSASLIMNTAQGNVPTQTSVHRVLANWGEGNSHASGNEGGGTTAQLNDATWTHRFFGTSQTWNTAGGDFASATTTATVSALGSVVWSGAGLVADLQGWLTTPATNFGWLLHGNESTFGTTVRYASRQNATVSARPSLVVIYTPPTKVDEWELY